MNIKDQMKVYGQFCNPSDKNSPHNGNIIKEKKKSSCHNQSKSKLP